MTYDIIYMDPPWWYAGQTQTGSDKKPSSSAEDHYPTMKMHELKELDVQALANKDCLIYMWTSSPHLAQSIELGQHWGFDYITVAFCWDKHMVNPGFYTLSQVELCLVFKNKGGKIPRPRGARNVKQFISEKRREHSRKPDDVRKRIELMHPEQSKLEMFARTAAPGWDVWGNETNKFNYEEMDSLQDVQRLFDI